MIVLFCVIWGREKYQTRKAKAKKIYIYIKRKDQKEKQKGDNCGAQEKCHNSCLGRHINLKMKMCIFHSHTIPVLNGTHM